MGIHLFGKKNKAISYDKEKKKPVIKCSICNGEQIAGFMDIHTGAFEEITLIRNDIELEEFMHQYGITQIPEKIY